jgi:hypothetical protein
MLESTAELADILLALSPSLILIDATGPSFQEVHAIVRRMLNGDDIQSIPPVILLGGQGPNSCPIPQSPSEARELLMRKRVR